MIIVISKLGDESQLRGCPAFPLQWRRLISGVMQIHSLVNTFGQDLLHRYGEKIHKLTLHGSFTCPNRDGTLGKGVYLLQCGIPFADEGTQQLSIGEQLAARKDEIYPCPALSGLFSGVYIQRIVC